MFSWSRFAAIAGKEFIHMRRDRLTFAIMLGIPIIQLTLFGFAINTNVDHIPMVACDFSNSQQGREFVQKLVNTSYFDFVDWAANYDDAKSYLDQEKAKTAVLIPPDFDRDLKRGRAQVSVLVDASDPLLASSALSTAAQVGLVMNIDIMEASGGRAGLDNPTLDVRTRALYNPDLRSAVYIVPGLIGVILTMTMVLITSVAIVRERERGALEALITTPVSKVEMMSGKIMPYIAVGYIQMTLVFIVAWLFFGIVPQGNIAFIYLVGFLFIVASLGVGMVISTIAKTQIQSMQMSFFFFLPNILLSGFMFPISSMPWIVQKLTLVLPLTYFLVFLRGVMLKGTGPAELWPYVWPLLIFAPAIVSIGVLKFSKKLS